ncbi:flavodoxin [Methanofollis fontis]|uniref:Flavodoxin n=1 Tax=Methanofollis fontis TaxID=2052832 RepID=A0A483CNW7_9EURY|nr:flavodoxin [Methanofollis fontis]TAJ44292.1 flavodoxin [Methanofollis fontis]
MKINDEKCLIAYYSRPGSNYVSGAIVDLPVGNTEVIAKMIHEMTAGDLFHIEPVHAYPEDYTETTEVAQQELRTNARPELASHLQNIASFEVIFLGYPNWWGTMPMLVFTFLEGSDLSGKTIVPFCTHEGSGLGRSVSDIRKMCPKSTVLEGLAIRGGDVRNAQNAVSGWLQRLGMKKEQ